MKSADIDLSKYNQSIRHGARWRGIASRVAIIASGFTGVFAVFLLVMGGLAYAAGNTEAAIPVELGLNNLFFTILLYGSGRLYSLESDAFKAIADLISEVEDIV